MLLNIQFAMVIGFCGFAVSGISRWIFAGILFRKKQKAEKSESESDAEVESAPEKEEEETE
jgi:hypothetical protein